MEALAIIGDIGLNVLDDKDVARCNEIFTMYDEDNDGKLTYGELLTVLRCCGRNPTVEEFKELVQVVDEKLDGALDFEQYLSLYVMQLKHGPNNEKDLLEAFQAFDKAGNGFIMVDDLREVLTSLGQDKMTEEEADTLLKIADVNGDGILDYDEIVEVMTAGSQSGALTARGGAGRDTPSPPPSKPPPKRVDLGPNIFGSREPGGVAA